jgi:hypothetical protein
VKPREGLAVQFPICWRVTRRSTPDTTYWGVGLHPREHTAVGVDEQIVLRIIRKGDGACAIRIDGIRAGVFGPIRNVAAKVS